MQREAKHFHACAIITQKPALPALKADRTCMRVSRSANVCAAIELSRSFAAVLAVSCVLYGVMEEFFAFEMFGFQRYVVSRRL